MLRRVLASALVALVVVAPVARAQTQGNAGSGPAAKPASGFNWVLEGALEFGGDEIVELQFQDGSTQKLTGGQGGTIAFGGQYRLAAVPRLAIGATLGYKFVTNASSNASIGITRLPIEVVGRWSLENNWWVGAGVVQHSAVKVKGDGFFPDTDLDAGIAPTLELGWKWAALTYTAMTYTAPNDEEFSASAIGVSFRWVIGQK